MSKYRFVLLDADNTLLDFDRAEEIALPGQVHYCPKGHTHTTISAGDEDLLMLAVVPEQ